jgi:hypothetical protein
VVRETDLPVARRGDDIKPFIASTLVPVDLHVFTPDEMAEYGRDESSFVYTVLTTGVSSSKTSVRRSHILTGDRTDRDGRSCSNSCSYPATKSRQITLPCRRVINSKEVELFNISGG